MTPQQARERLDELVATKVAAATMTLQNELVMAKRDKLTCYYQGYVDGMSDDPTLKDVEGIRFLTLEQRKVKAAMRYFQSLRLPPQHIVPEVKPPVAKRKAIKRARRSPKKTAIPQN